MKPPEEVLRDLVREWIERAEEDLAVARNLYEQRVPYLASIGFHAQQATEKFLKAFLVRLQITFEKWHNLGLLLDLIAGVDGPLADSLREVTELNPYAVAARYPKGISSLSFPLMERAIGLASKTRDAILDRLKSYLAT